MLGYCVFPLAIAALVAVFVKMLWIRLPICVAALVWSIWGQSLLAALSLRTDCWLTALLFAPAAAVNFLGGTRLEKDRAMLAIYPLCMLFFLLSWMTLLS